MPYPYIDKDKNASKIDPKSQKYIVTFKPKNERQNKRDDKLEILKSALGLGDYENVFNVSTDIRNDTKRQQAKKNLRTISDINRYTTPFLMLRLTESQYHRLRKNPNIKSIVKDTINYPTVQTIPWGIDRVKTQEAWQISSDAFGANLRRRGTGVKVCIQDTGIDASHEDLNVFQGISFTDLGLDVFFPQPGGHGTHVAGTVGALDNDIGVVGVAPDCILIDHKIFGSSGGSFLADQLEAHTWALEHGVNVLNQSYGSFTPAAEREPEKVMFQDLVNQGVIICTAMGNNMALSGEYPADGFYPAAHVENISVAAINRGNAPASYTNFGNPTDICAPGGDFPLATEGILSTFPGNLYEMLAGTSMATPCVAGCCALALSNFKWNDCNTIYELGGGGPSLNRQVLIRQIMFDTADSSGLNPPFAPNNPDGVRNIVYGHGCISVDRMVERLLVGAAITGSGGIGIAAEHGF